MTIRLPRSGSFDVMARGQVVRDGRQRTGGKNSDLEAASAVCRGIRGRMIRKLKSGQFRLYSRKKDASTGKRRNLGTFESLEKAKQHEREIQYFKRH